ncbi:MAG: hypothetical protein IPJ77_14530 [Planctomycetes bacterium]|nr:hypothetical protein [Planctomycetota bacterium]
MKKLVLFAWLLLPVGAFAYHFGPGQTLVREDAAAAALERASDAAARARSIAAKDGDDAARDAWSEADEAYGEALAALPPERVGESRAIRLERAKAQMFLSKLPEVRRDLEGLVEELANDPATDAALLADARGTLANSKYYMTWLMRLEGAPREDWEKEIESSRQIYKLLAEEAESKGDASAALRAKEDLESAVKLARAELHDLQGLPLPSQ